jgi:Zn-dependent protease with chaperone function
MDAVERSLRQLVTAAPSAGLPPVPNFDWPTTFNYAPGHGTNIYFLGRRLVIGEGLFRNKYLKALVASALGHWNSTDVELREILACIPPGWMVLMILVGLPVGLGCFVTFLFWPWYWRQRVFASDLFAARVGQLDELIDALDHIVHPHEKQQNVLIREYPYVAERISRLMHLRNSSGMVQPMSGQQQSQRGNHP